MLQLLAAAIPALMQGLAGTVAGTAAGGIMGGMPNTGPPGMTPAFPTGEPPGVRGTDPMALPPMAGESGPQMPQAPTAASPYAGGDVSGFANAGMTPPLLPDPAASIQGLMSMNANPQRQQQQQQPGSLMGYLQMLARG